MPAHRGSPGIDRETVDIRPDLEQFDAPTLVVWGTADEFFETRWARWLADTIPGTVRCVEVPGAKLSFPLERPEALNAQLRRLWSDDARS
jgi:pimeloyl-ACP methyl ester carboxylesterase